MNQKHQEMLALKKANREFELETKLCERAKLRMASLRHAYCVKKNIPEFYDNYEFLESVKHSKKFHDRLEEEAIHMAFVDCKAHETPAWTARIKERFVNNYDWVTYDPFHGWEPQEVIEEERTGHMNPELAYIQE